MLAIVVHGFLSSYELFASILTNTIAKSYIFLKTEKGELVEAFRTSSLKANCFIVISLGCSAVHQKPF